MNQTIMKHSSYNKRVVSLLSTHHSQLLYLKGKKEYNTIGDSSTGLITPAYNEGVSIMTVAVTQENTTPHECVHTKLEDILQELTAKKTESNVPCWYEMIECVDNYCCA